MAIHLSAPIRDAMLDQARACYPAQGCGVVIGYWKDAVAVGSYYHPCGSRIMADGEAKSPCYLVTPERYRAIEQQASEEGLCVVSLAHSQSQACPHPCEFDRRNTPLGLGYIIMSISSGRPTGYRCWRLCPDRQFEPEELRF